MVKTQHVRVFTSVVTGVKQKGVKMAQAKRKTATKTAKKQTRQTRQRSNQRSNQKKQQQQHPNTFFLVSMSFLAATLLVMNLLMLNI